METAYIIRNGVIIGSGTNSSLNPDSSSTYIINCTVAMESDGTVIVENYDGDFTKTQQTIADGGKVELRTNFNSSNYILEPSRIEENYVTFNTIDKNANITIKVTEYGINDVSYIDLNSGGTGSGEENKIDSISVNGSPITPDENKNVDITVPDAYDDTALVQRISGIESDYAKSSDIPSLSGYATETWVNEQGFLTQHQDLSNYATKDELPSLDGYATESYVTEQISNIPSVDLTDYAKKNEIPDVSGYITEEQLLAKDYADKAYVTEEIAKASTGGGVEIDDSKSSSDTTYSSSKIVELTSKYAMSFNSSTGKLSITLK